MMTKPEKALLSFIDRHLLQIALVALTAAAFLLRFSLRDHYSYDYNYYLALWYQEIATNGLARQVGNYNFAYQFLIWCMTKLPIYPLYAYKLLSCAFDLVLAAVVALILRETLSSGSEEAARRKSFLGYCLTLAAPTVFLNSALWAQCDSIYTAFALLALL